MDSSTRAFLLVLATIFLLPISVLAMMFNRELWISDGFCGECGTPMKMFMRQLLNRETVCSRPCMRLLIDRKITERGMR